MARDLTAAVSTATDDVVYPLNLFEFSFDSGTLRFFTGLGDLTWDSKTWTGAGEILRFSQVTETTSLRAEGVTFVLSGVPATLIDYVESEDYQGRPVKVWVALLDSSGAIKADPYEIFRGKMDVMQDQAAGDTVTITLSAESDLVDFERARVRRYTNEDQQETYSGDLFFEFVPDLQEREIKGK